MLSSALRYFYNRLDWKARNGGGAGVLPGSVAGLGDELDRKVGCVRGVYDFAVQGGAAGTQYILKDKQGFPVKLPKNSIVTHVFVHTLTAVTSGGAATVSLGVNTATDLLNVEAKASFALNAMVKGIPQNGDGTTAVLVTADANVYIKPATAALTAGKVNVFIFYVLSGTD